MTDDPFEPARRLAAAEHANGKLSRLMDALPAELRAELAAMWRLETVPAGRVLVEDGQEPDRVGYLLGGLLGMAKRLPDGRDHIIGFLIPSDMYGRPFDGRSAFRIEALADSEVMTCDRDRFEALLDKAPEAEHLFIVNVLDELDAAREWVLVLGGPKVVQRVASLLLILARRQLSAGPVTGGGRAGPINLRLALRRADLARYLGARPESLSRAFRELEEDGAIRINTPYDFDLLDLARLIEVAGHDLVMAEPAARRRFRAT